MKKYFASHIYEEDINGIPMEVLPMNPEDKWADDRRWTTAASEAGAKKNVRAKIRKDLGYGWKEIQHVDMVFGPVKKETYLGLYNMPVVAVENESVNKEERIMNKKEMVKNSNAVLMQIINKRTNEEKRLFSQIWKILHDSDCYVNRSIDKPDTHVLLIHEEEGVLVSVNSAIEFGREIYTEISQLVDETNAKAIRNRLSALFSKKAEKPATDNPYESMAKEEANRWILTAEVVLQYLKPGKEKPEKFTVKRKITVVKVEDKFYNGYVYHSNGQYLGHWYWNVKYNRPSFKPNQDIGDYNQTNYEYAIRKALRTIGLHSEYMPESADRYAKKAV